MKVFINLHDIANTPSVDIGIKSIGVLLYQATIYSAYCMRKPLTSFFAGLGPDQRQRAPDPGGDLILARQAVYVFNYVPLSNPIPLMISFWSDLVT